MYYNFKISFLCNIMYFLCKKININKVRVYFD